MDPIIYEVDFDQTPLNEASKMSGKHPTLDLNLLKFEEMIIYIYIYLYYNMIG